MDEPMFGGSAEEAGWYRRGHVVRVLAGGKVLWEDRERLAAMRCAACGKDGLECRCGYQHGKGAG